MRLLVKLLVFGLIIAGLQVTIYHHTPKEKPSQIVKRAIRARCNHQGIIFLGDSVNFTCDHNEEQREPVSTLLQDELGKYVATVSGGGLDTDVFLAICKFIEREPAYLPKMMVIGINLAGFHGMPEPYTTHKQIGVDLYRADHPWFDVFLKPITTFRFPITQADLSLYEHVNTKIYRGGEYIGLNGTLDIKNPRYKNFSPSNTALYISIRYFYDLDPVNNKNIKELGAITDVLLRNNIRPIFYITPINYERCSAFYPEKFTADISSKVAAVTDFLQKRGVPLLDLSFALENKHFTDAPYPDEHLNYSGRLLLAKSIANYITNSATAYNLVKEN